MKVHLVFSGVVQGVGFRPFVYRVATKYNLSGFVRNIGKGVEVVFSGEDDDVEKTIDEIKSNPPPQARIDKVFELDKVDSEYSKFEILKTPEEVSAAILVPPDIGICDNCRDELLDLNNPRYNHLFISCTDCGPRLSVLRNLPYDRQSTSSGDFQMCSFCKSEYIKPSNRRYHAQTIACKNCGPIYKMGNLKGEEAVYEAKRLILSGNVVAIKGIGGFHLACLASSDKAVKKIRQIKNRGNEPMAVMVFGVNDAKLIADLESCELDLLKSWRKPIVIVKKSHNYLISPLVAPDTDKIGIFLPYTPLHVVLICDMPPVVLTSANLHEEPIITDNPPEILTPHILTNDREITIPIDDSVARCVLGKPQLVRRARSYVPELIPLKSKKSVLALGGQMKNTFTFSWDDQALVSHHIGEMGNATTFERFRESLEHFRQLFGFKESICAHDLHPSYETTLYKKELTIAQEFIPIQHHHAHIAAVLGEHNIHEPIIGIAADGTGYGSDGTIWGFEFLVAKRADFKRVGHLRPFRLPGGEVAIRDCKRIAYSLAYQSGLEKFIDVSNKDVLKTQLQKSINAPWTSSLGRLFDGFAVLAGLGPFATYEAELAIALESIYMKPDKLLTFKLEDHGEHFEIDWRYAISEAFENPKNISGRFHAGIASVMVDGCKLIREKTGINRVALSGGCFLNKVLLEMVWTELTTNKFDVYTNFALPPGDGCLSFGQAVVAQARIGG